MGMGAWGCECLVRDGGLGWLSSGDCSVLNEGAACLRDTLCQLGTLRAALRTSSAVSSSVMTHLWLLSSAVTFAEMEVA